MRKTVYFFNEGVIFDNNDKNNLHDCWNYNPFCCKSDLSNGLWCSEYGIEFNKEKIIKELKANVIDGHPLSYGYYKIKTIDIDNNLYNQIIEDLVKNYHYKNKEDAENNGFIPFEYSDLIEDYSSYWEMPTESWLKDENGVVRYNELQVKKQFELNPDIMNYINKELYGEVTKAEKEINKDIDNNSNIEMER